MTRHAAPEARKRAERRGRWSEWLAVLFLMAKGYRILALRYRVRAGEIDIIARRGALVAFVEVKARRDLMAAIDAVTFASQNRIRAAGDHWLSRQPDAARLSLRYDIVAITPWKLPRHYQGAF
ncbi:MAG: YraN family protein [Arenimonas sp.]|nr:YraN family protein [Rhizobium sp.]MBW8447167.1 YraN family protein [Arenimonas sp.]